MDERGTAANAGRYPCGAALLCCASSRCASRPCGQRPLTPPGVALRAPLDLRALPSALRLTSGRCPPRWRLAAGVSASQVRRCLRCPVMKPFRWRGSFRLCPQCNRARQVVNRRFAQAVDNLPYPPGYNTAVGNDTPPTSLQVLHDLYHPRKPPANPHLSGRPDYGRNRPNQSATRQRQVTAIGAAAPPLRCRLPAISPAHVLPS